MQCHYPVPYSPVSNRSIRLKWTLGAVRLGGPPHGASRLTRRCLATGSWPPFGRGRRRERRFGVIVPSRVCFAPGAAIVKVAFGDVRRTHNREQPCGVVDDEAHG